MVAPFQPEFDGGRGSDTVLAITRRGSLWGPLTVVMKYSDKAWGEAIATHISANRSQSG
jgi:hypothetical protein